MATQELALRDQTPNSLQEVMTLGKIFAASGFFKDITSEAKAVVQILAGREYGFGPFSSLTGIHIIQGKPTLSAHLMATAIKRSGKYNYRVKSLTDTGCTITFLEADEIVGESTFDEGDAKKAGLLGKEGNMWGKYPRNMYFARALSNGAKFYCPDIFEAGAYVEGEIPDEAIQRPKVVSIGEPEVVTFDSLESASEPQEAAGAPEKAARAPQAPEAGNDAAVPTVQELVDMAAQLGWTEEQLTNRMRSNFKRLVSLGGFTPDERARTAEMMRKQIAKKQAELVDASDGRNI